MPAKTAMLHIRVGDNGKAQAADALADPQPARPLDQVLREARALIDGKRRA